MINISCVWKCCMQLRDQFQNATEAVRFYGSRAQSVRVINTSLTRVRTPDLWPALKTGANTNKHNTKPHSHQLKLHCVPLKPTKIISSRCSSLVVAPWNATTTVIQSISTSLRLSGYNQGRAVLFKELTLRLSWATNMTRPLMIFISVTCLIFLSQSFVCYFLRSIPQTYHSLREITDPSMWDT